MGPSVSVRLGQKGHIFQLSVLNHQSQCPACVHILLHFQAYSESSAVPSILSLCIYCMSFGITCYRSPTRAAMPCGQVMSISHWPLTISLQVRQFKFSLMEPLVLPAGVLPCWSPGVVKMCHFHSQLHPRAPTATTGRSCWKPVRREEVSQLTHTHIFKWRRRRLWCPLLSNDGLWSERLGWFKIAWDMWWWWYGRRVHVADNVFGPLSLTVFCACVCVCVWVCVYYSERMFSHMLSVCVRGRCESTL